LCGHDFVFAVCMIGSFISEMGFLLSFLFMTGWITKYSDVHTAKEISQEVGTLSLLIGNGFGLALALLAENT